MIWDYNIVLNNPNTGDTASNPPGGNLFDVQSGQDPNMAAMEATPSISPRLVAGLQGNRQRPHAPGCLLIQPSMAGTTPSSPAA